MPLVALVDGERTLATPDGPRRATCPGCDTEMIARTGRVVTVNEFTEHVLHGHRPPSRPRFGESLDSATWSSPVTTAQPPPPPPPRSRSGTSPRRTGHILDWSHRNHWNGGLHVPCTHCGEPTYLLDDNGNASHKSCAEAAMAT